MFVEGNMLFKKLKIQKLHNQNHYDQNRLYELCKQLYFSISRFVVKEVCDECNICLQAHS